MATRPSLRRVAVSATAVTVVAMALKRRADQRAALRFYERAGEPGEFFDRGAFHGGLPSIWHRSEASESLHAAPLEAVQELLPSPDLHPVRLTGGRTIIAVSCFRHEEFSAQGIEGLAMLPYGEVMISALVTRRPAPPLLPLLAPARTGMGWGAFVLHLPVTSKAARDGGRGWGYPKFTADIEFEDSVETVRTTLSEGGRRVLTHTVRPAGRPTVTGTPRTLYSVHHGQLLEQSVPWFALQRRRWGGDGGLLELGDHQVADELRGLNIEPQPFVALHLDAVRISFPGVRAIGPARPYLGYIGDERELGRYVVTYPGTGPIDRYAPYATTAGPSNARAVSVTPAA